MVAPNWKRLLDGLISSEGVFGSAVLDTIGTRLVAYGEGSCQMEWRPTEAWWNPDRASIFGGGASSALEAAYGFAFCTVLDDGEMPVAVRCETDFVRPVHAGVTYMVEATIVERSGAGMFGRGEITGPDGRIVALGSLVGTARKSRDEQS